MIFLNIGELRNTGALPVGTRDLKFRVEDQCSGREQTLTIVVNNIVSLSYSYRTPNSQKKMS